MKIHSGPHLHGVILDVLNSALKAGSAVGRQPRRPSIVWIRPRLLGRSRCGFARWHDPEREGRNLFPGFERTGNLVADRVQTLEKSRDRHGVIRCECRKSVPRHDRRQDAAVRPFTDLYRLHDLLWGPTTDAGLFVGCDVSAHKDTLTRNLEAHIRAAEKA